MIETVISNGIRRAIEHDGEKFHVQQVQAIPQEFKDYLDAQRTAEQTGEVQSVGRIPATLIPKMQADGLDFWNADIPEILKWLKANGYEGFITTSKRWRKDA